MAANRMQIREEDAEEDERQLNGLTFIKDLNKHPYILNEGNFIAKILF